MDYSYDEILERMNDKFYELSGYNADSASDIGIKLRLLAGEVFSLTSDIDFIKKQMFPNTASGEYLDLHAQQRGLSRISGSKASGNITFAIDTPLDYEFIIPSGTICTVPDGSLNFIVTEDTTLFRGGTYVIAPAEAEKTGTQYNISTDTVSTVVTYFSAGVSVTNSTIFTGGTDDEDDEALRERIAYSMQNISNGANAAYYISLAKSVDEIQSASIVTADVPEPYTFQIFLGGKGCCPSAEKATEVRKLIYQKKSIGIEIYVSEAAKVEVPVDVSISIDSSYDFDEVKESVENAVTKFFEGVSVGEKVYLTAIGDAVFNCDGVVDYSFNDMSDIEVTLKQLAVLSEITVSEA